MKGEIYHKTEKTGRCEYRIWDPVLKRLRPCGAPACRWRAEGKTRGGFMLCDQHGAFVADARAHITEEDI